MSEGQPRLQFRLRTVAVLFGIISILLAAYVVWDRSMHAFFKAVMVGNPGPVESAEDWPRPLQRLVADASTEQSAIDNLKVHCFSSVFDLEYVWRMDATPALIDFLKARYELVPTDPRMRSFFRATGDTLGNSKPWWSPSGSNDSEYLACPHFLARDPGDRF